MRQPAEPARRLSTMRPSLAVRVVILAACAAPAAPTSTPSSAGPDPIGAWRLAEGTVDGRPLRLLDDHPVTAVVEGSAISGRSACNEYGGRLEVAGDGVRIGELGGTEMACAPEDVMALEQEYLAALGRVRSIGVVDGQLAMRGDAVDLRFEPLPAPPTAELVDTAWVLETVFVGDVASPADGEPATLELRSDGTFHGSTGCRTFTGRWIEFGEQIQAPEMRMGELECPARLVDQDSHVVGVIGDGFVPTIDGDLLTLLDPGGVGLVYRADE